MKNITVAACAVFFAVLAGCGGGGSDAPAAASLAAATLPAITAQPQNTTVIAGQDANFSVTATGTGTLSYQWKRGGTAVAGATSASYKLSPTQTADNGASFTVDVSNSAGLVTSSAAVLTVNVPPAIATQPKAASAAAGQPVTFSVTATGTAPLIYQWKIGGKTISGATASTLTLSPATAQNNGASYTVDVTNIAGTVTSTAAVLRIVPPIELLAGSLGGPGNLDGALANARIGAAGHLTMAANGDVVFIDSANNKVREINFQSGLFTTIAGSGAAGSTDGAGTAAKFNFAQSGGIAVDSSGNYYVADTGNSTIRKIAQGGVVTTLAGVANTVGSTNGAGPLALFNRPTDITFSSDGSLYVADAGNNAIRRVTLSGVVTTIAGGTGAGSANGTGVVAKFNNPMGIAAQCPSTTLGCFVGPEGVHLYVADSGNNMIRDLVIGGTATSPTYAVSTLAGATSQGSTDGTGTAARFFSPQGILFAGPGVLYVADTGNYTLRKIDAAAIVTTVAGKAGEPGSVNASATASRFGAIASLLTYAGIASNGQAYTGVVISDGGVLRLLANGTVSNFAGVPAVVGNADGTGFAAQFSAPRPMATDATGNLYVADWYNSRVRRISPAGAVTTVLGAAGAVAGPFTFPLALTVDSSANIWVGSISGLQKLVPGSAAVQFSGTDAAGAAVVIPSVSSLAADTSGNVYVAGGCRISKITPAGVVSAVAGGTTCGYLDGTGAAAKFSFIRGLAVTTDGALIVVDAENYLVRKVSSGGVVTTLAGSSGAAGFADGAGSAARFGYMWGIALDASGSAYVTDPDNAAIRKISVGGSVTTVVGNPAAKGITLGALPGSLNSPWGIAVLPGSDLSLAVSDDVENAVVTISFP